MPGHDESLAASSARAAAAEGSQNGAAIRAVTVYCSSSTRVGDIYHDAARRLGTALAKQGWALVYGGNNVGTMGTLANAVRTAGGKVIGITPKLLEEKGIADHAADELIVLDDMRQRKAAMEDRGDAFIALPGGLGTLEELFEIIVGRQLAYHHKPIVILNVAGFYDPLLAMLEHVYTEGYASEARRDSYHVATTPQQALDLTRKSQPAFKPGT